MSPDERKELIREIASAIQPQHGTHMLSEDEARWVKMAIQKEAQSIELRKAIIEKTLSGLIWSFLIGAGYVVLDFLRGHGVNL